jgi:hypothetical protein
MTKARIAESKNILMKCMEDHDHEGCILSVMHGKNMCGCLRYGFTSILLLHFSLEVHEATTHDGRRVAVKVQHAGIRESSVADIATIELLVAAVRVIFPVS